MWGTHTLSPQHGGGLKFSQGIITYFNIYDLVQLANCVYLCSMKTNKITQKYEQRVQVVLYEEAVELLELLTDEEYADLVEQNPELLATHFTEDDLKDTCLLRQLIAVFCQALEARPLTEQDLEEMSKSELQSYIWNLVVLPTQSYKNILAAINELKK